MELIFLALMAIGALWVARQAGFCISDQSVFVLVRGFRAAAGVNDWPRGVQEEDWERPWGRSTRPVRADARELRIPVTRVKPKVRAR
jgi:hypothetical protein